MQEVCVDVMRRKHKNIYMGLNSTARLPVFGKVDTDNEICLNAIATAYDALNNIMLTRNEGVLDKTTLQVINNRFSVLKMLCRRYAPDKLNLIEKIHKLVVDNYKGGISDGQALSLMHDLCIRYNVNPGMLNIAMLHVNQVEMQDPLGMNAFLMFNQQIPNRRKKVR